MRAAAVLLVVAACDGVFGLDTLRLPADAAIDVAPACENSAPFGSDCRTITLPLTSDTYLSAATPDTAFGARDAVKISSTEPGLFEFLTSEIAPGERIAAMTLTLDPIYSKNTMACSSSGTTCTPCPAPALGMWRLYYASTIWNEAQATWNAPWTAPGASAIPNDRSDVIASGPPTATTGDFVMSISSDALLAHSPDCFRRDDSLALLVTLEGAAYFDALQPNRCSVLGKKPELSVTLCR